MSKNDEFKNFKSEIDKLKKERENKNHYWNENDDQDKAVIERVKLEFEPVLKAFLETDRFLNIQSNSERGVYIAYANTKICGILVSATSLEDIDITFASGSILTCIYRGQLNKKEIRNEVKNALIDWYRMM